MNRLALASVALTAAVAIQSSGCGGDGVGGGPVPWDAGVTSTSSSTSSGVGGSGGQTPITPKRTVAQRNPYGNVAARNNLLWDGDFEWRSAFADQYGWMSSKGGYMSFAPPALELGWKCRSGLKCALLGPNHRIMGLAVSSIDHDLAISFWAKPAGGHCSELSAVFFTMSDSEQNVEVEAEATAPDGEGWCHYAVQVSERLTAARLYIENVGQGPAIVDDAVIEPVETQPTGLTSKPPTSVTLPAWVRQWSREATRPRVTPPNEAERRFRAGLKRRWRR
ncbi:MAG: hypothetical protein JRI68_35715 [Deltaproteobacteria bacterium]|nr:hypothetical protein [Deltaproteobacteria bacterium]